MGWTLRRIEEATGVRRETASVYLRTAGSGHTQKTPLRGMRFETIEQAQSYLDRWEMRWADSRIRGTTKRQVAAMFAEVIVTGVPLTNVMSSDVDRIQPPV